jgi:hypothetical protein
MTFLIGITLLAIGIVFAIRTEWFLRLFGSFLAAETTTLRIFGGSRLIYKLIGFIFIFLGFLFMVGLGDNFFLWLFKPILNLTFGTNL